MKFWISFVETQNRDHLDQHRKRRRKMRANVISEILHAEKKYIQDLDDILTVSLWFFDDEK